jgi:hypothetical protein
MTAFYQQIYTAGYTSNQVNDAEGVKSLEKHTAGIK